MELNSRNETFSLVIEFIKIFLKIGNCCASINIAKSGTWGEEDEDVKEVRLLGIYTKTFKQSDSNFYTLSFVCVPLWIMIGINLDKRK
jgi:hypothetical protein